MATHGGTVADVGDRQIFLTLHGGFAGVNTKGQIHHILGDGQICRGDTQGSAQFPSGDHGPRENMGMAQEPARFLHITCFQMAADVGGGDGDVPKLLLRYHRIGHMKLPAVVGQKLCVAFAAVSEAEIMSTDKTGRTIAFP